MSDKDTLGLSRRRLLGGLGAIGVASAGAGLGTSAYFSDTESFENNILTAGELDLLVDYYSHWDQGMAGSGSVSGTADGEAVTAELSDMKPGDNGLLVFCPRIETNPAYMWLCGELTANEENGQPEPEENHSSDTTTDEGELAQSIELTVSYCELENNVDGDNGSIEPSSVGSSTEIGSGTLAEFLSAIQNGVPLDGNGAVDGGGFLEPGEQDCYAGTADEGADDNPCLCIEWELPAEVGNEVQTDIVEFDLAFYAQQCRHNDGTDNPCGIPTSTGDGFAKVSESFNGDETSSAGARARYGNNGASGAWELGAGDEPGVSGEFEQANYEWTSGSTVDWTVDYTASSDELSFTFDGTNVTDTIDDPQPDGRMAVQGKADEATVDATVDSLTIGGSSASLSGPTSVSVSNDGSGRNVGYLLIDTALDGATDFEVSGTATVTIQGDYPGGDEDVAFDVVFE